MNPQDISANNSIGLVSSQSNNNNLAMATSQLPPSVSILKSNYHKDVIRLIGQHLVTLGLKQTVNQLLEESGLKGLDDPVAEKFQQDILNGNWGAASSSVDSIAEYTDGAYVDSNGDDNRKAVTSNKLKLLIAQQKFLELIEDNQHIKALKCLRLELTPLISDTKQIQQLATLLMCKSIDEVRLKANWPGKGIKSRQMLVEQIQRFLPPLIMLPPRRLHTLLSQAVQLQQERCPLHIDTKQATSATTTTANDFYHNNGITTTTTTSNGTINAATNSNNHASNNDGILQNANRLQTSSLDLLTDYVDLKKDHVCSADKFPLQTTQELDSHKAEVWHCKFSNDGKKLATGGVGGKVKIWDLDLVQQRLIERCTLDCNSYSITCLAWSPNDSHLLVTGSEDHPDLWIWVVDKEDVKQTVNHNDEDAMTTCAWHSCGELFAAASIKGNFSIYDIEGKTRGSRPGVRVQCLSFLHKDPNLILAADALNRIKSYTVKDFSIDSEEDDILEERHPIMSFIVDEDDRYIAVNLMDQGVHLWDYRLKTLLRMFPGVCQRNLVIFSSFSSPNANFLASGSEDGKVYIYHLQKDQPVAILHGHSRCVNCVTWNPKYPQFLVSVSDDRIVRLWAPKK